jgi:hypothetical protein
MENLSDNQNNSDSETYEDTIQTEKKKKVRNKNKLYPVERKAVLNRLMSILMKENENTFCSHEIESNEEKKNQIEELNSDILKYFNVSTWSAFKQNQVVEKKTISTIRSIFKEMNVEYESYTSKKKENDKTINTTIYIVKK